MARKNKKSFMTPKASRRKARKRLSTTTGRVKKEFTYRGYTMEELSQMELWPSEGSDNSIIELLPSRARRSIGRGMSVENEHFLDRVRRNSSTTVRTHRRDMPILPEFVGRRIAIHNGQHFIELDVKPEMIGHYLGEFALSRKNVAHSGPGVGATRSSKHVALK
ncbi:MAG: 30S ribosomal protein S19 [Candidatus Poseidoniaceae archaeon]|jgi:small subunit ribosomal protein S19|nr:30S ribosomal protein S19 [Candidatus Poseidoniaceae archaeon]|tara:strand:+ start:3898 stop:4389 length:492 start_codon:yes stop_codon:yes gene_type:complete